MRFEMLVLTEAVMCLLLLTAFVQSLAELAAAPELDLGERAWVAGRFCMTEAKALGPLFKHLVGASRGALQLAHSMQEDIRAQRERWVVGPLGPLVSLWQRWRIQRSE